MTVKELISKLRQSYKVEIREDNYFLCETKSDNKAINLFANRKVIDWFPSDHITGVRVGLVINISSEESDEL